MKANQRFGTWLALPIFLIAIGWSGQARAATVASVQTGDWNNTATWDCGCVPGAGDTITISNGTTVKLDTTRHTGNLTVNGTLDTFNQFLEFEGTTFTNNGSIISSTSTDGEIDFNGVGAASGTTQTIAGTGTYASSGFLVDIHIINATTVTPAASTVIGGVTPLLIANGSTLSLPSTFVFKNGTITNSGTISGAGKLQTQGSVTITAGSTTAPFEVVNGTTTGSGNFGKVTIDNGAISGIQAGTLTANGDFTVASGGSLDMHNQFLEFQGTIFTNSGSISSSTSIDGEIDFNGVGAASGTTQTIAGTGTYASSGFLVDIHIINTTTVTPAAGTVIGGVTPLSIAAGSTLSLSNTLVFSNGTITNSGTISGAGTLQAQGPVTINSPGTITAPFEAVSGTTTASGNFKQITIDLGAALLQNGTITANGNFTVVSGGTLNTNQFLEFQGTAFTNNGSVIDTVDSFGEIDFNGIGGASSTAQTIAGTGVYAPAGSNPMEIHIINTTAVTPASGTVIGSVRNLSIAAGSTLSLPNTLVFKNGTINNGGAISGAGTLQTQGPATLNSTGAITAPCEAVSGTTTGSGNFGKMTIDNGAQLFQSASLTPNGDLIVASGSTLDMNNQFLFFQGSTFTDNGSVISSTGSGELRFNGVAGSSSTTQAMAGAGTYDPTKPVDLHIVAATTVTAASGTVINGVRTFTIEPGSTFNFTGSGGITLSNGVSNGGVVNLNGGGAACGDATKILLRSSVPGTQRAWSGGGTFSMTDVDVQDQAGGAAITVIGGINSGNNGANWSFANCPGTPTPAPTATATATATATSTPTATATATPKATATSTPNATPTPTPTAGPSQLLNIATRLRVQTGENVLIGGFIITGTDPKKVIVRAIGPSLAQFFAGALADTTLELHSGNGTLLASNDNWKTRPDGSSQQAEIEATTIPPSNDLESAIVITLPAGNAGYTAIVRGKNDTTGIGVVEAYDLDQAANSRLGNIATRGFVDSGDNVMIGGLIIGGGGGGNGKVVVRAIGPTLGNFGIAGALQDPTLELHDGNGNLLVFDNNWQDDPSAAEVQADNLAPNDPRESAVVRSLPPGAYTAIVRGNGGATGVGLVEVYNVQ